MNQATHQDLTGVLDAVTQAGLFSAVCSISAFPDPESGGINSWGQIDLSTATPVSGLQNIPCMIAPMPQGQPGLNERRTSEVIEQYNVFHALLAGYFPQIQQRQIAIIDTDPPYQILNAESDSQSVMTRLTLRWYAL